MFRHKTASRSSRTSRSSSDADASQQTLVQRDKAFRLVRHGSDPLLNDGFYATQVQVGNFVKMGWLTKQGHMWKSWKTRFFVLFSDGTFVYYKNKGRKKIKGCMQLNDGVVSIQHVDVRVAEKPYVFQIEKGFYRLLCYCCSQFEAELWVTALRSVRRVAPPCFEMDLTATEEKAGSNAVTRLLNKIFITDKWLAKALEEFKVNEHDHSYASIHNFIVEIDDAVIDRHHLEFYQDPEIELLPGNELIRLIRRHVEDRVFIPLYAEAYSSLATTKLKERQSRFAQNLKVLKRKTQADFGIPEDLSSVCGWELAINVAKMLDCVSLPTHKFEVVLSIGKVIMESVAQYNGDLFEVSDETLTAVFRYVVTMSSLSDLPTLRALLKYGYQHHPACQNKANVVSAFLDAIKWVECFETEHESYQFDSKTLSASRVSVSISTNDIGIQFTTDARRGDLDSAAWLRGYNVEPNTLCSWEKSRGKQIFGFVPVSGKSCPLHAAVHNGQLGMVNYLLSKGADPNMCNFKGRRPLHVVKQSIDMAQIIESLIEGGADIDATEKHGLTPLMFMCSRGSLEGCATLLALGADVHCVSWSNGFSALEFAVKCGRHGLIRLFVMILLYKKSEAQGAGDLQERFNSLISHNIDIPKDKLNLLVEEYTALYVEYFSLRGAGNYAVNYEVIPGAMAKLYCQDSCTKTASTEPFPIHLHRYIDAERWAEQCTLITHAIFCKIPVQDFISTGSKQHSTEFTCIKSWFQHMSAYVINAVLVQNNPEERAEVISFYLKLSVASKKLMNEMQLLSDKGCREMNRLMRKTSNPSMPYIGLYLQGFVGLNELPVFDKEGLVNARRLRKMGELSMEILHRQSVAYALQNDEKIDKLLHVSLPYPSEESRYARSLELEPREADAIPLSDRGSCAVLDDDLDIESEVRESIGGEGTFGFRQWIRKQQVVHRNRSRSSLMAQYEWV
ncbi:hypothetical protein BBO99_00000623 [Phytophthora kernoviae]|uniref:PH domain-containing protein n=2 Tax=Phytophthora kernoviae TaxID=325452 RepID=A0A3R7K037_9STRA|nr:hypothetical protein G195_001630 [Phytophthora kernoviae 00238/432]KAG2530725.1 hypothetical protein JM16_001456 [Phytophthora kernoviae]RLN43788.1 hypothetical protein BBI17_001440 [Phytophthora kernoviae]RLN85373.1 hypothetical protein BBO99_00000623 [Phytophthora kernoviae]